MKEKTDKADREEKMTNDWKNDLPDWIKNEWKMVIERKRACALKSLLAAESDKVF